MCLTNLNSGEAREFARWGGCSVGLGAEPQRGPGAESLVRGAKPHKAEEF